MDYAFRCPVGANADAKELEYIASLHQTHDGDDDGWLDCSIEAADVKHFLMSRYGIDISTEEVRDRIFQGLAGGNELEECLDLTEMAAILLIPRLLKCVEEECQNEVKNDNIELKEQNFIKDASIEAKDDKVKLDERIPDEDTSIEIGKKNDIEELYPDKNTSIKIEEQNGGKKIIADVLKIILGDVFGSHEPVPLTPVTLRQIFAEYEELNLIDDDDLIENMIKMAVGDDPDALLDVEAFARALTNDVTLYDVSEEETLTSSYDDVFGEEHAHTQGDDCKYSRPSANSKNDSSEDISYSGDSESQSKENAPSQIISPLSTFPNVDFIADLYRSKMQIVLSFTLLVVFLLAFYLLADSNKTIDVCTNKNFGCSIGNKIFGWIYRLTQFMVSGTVILIVLNLGNNPRSVGILGILEIIASMVGTVIFTFIPANIEIQFWVFDTSRHEGNDILIDIINVIGAVLVSIQILHLVRIYKGSEIKYEKNSWITKFLTFGETYLKDEHAMKQAAAFKTNRMVNNAYALHQHISGAKHLSSNDMSTNARSLRNYNKASDDYELVGGLIWSLKMYCNGSLAKSEGVLFNSKHIIGLTVQCYFIIIFTIIYAVLSERYSSGYKELYPDPWIIDILDHDNILPQHWMLDISLALACIVSISVMIFVTLNLIPSIITTTLKLRTGFLPTLRDPLFKNYRSNIYSTAYVIGAMIWAPLIMGILLYFVTFLGIFLLVWQVTRGIVFTLVATVIGIVITILAKMLAIKLLLYYSHAAFYRKRVMLSNIATVALECWHIGITVLAMVSRLAKLLAVILYFLGRIDRPFLADDIKLDSFPLLFRQSILAMEAHRHPYIERLGVMYMMKLRHGNRFGSQAGSTWRLLFVFALMPWLRKYRIQDITDNEDITEQLGTNSNKNYVTNLEAENKSLKLQIEELRCGQDHNEDPLVNC